MSDLQTPSSVAFVSLGCPKNLVDSERMLGSLREAGGLEFGCLQELAEVRNIPMVFISTVSYERQGCGRWVALGRELDLKLVRLDAVESAVVRSSDLAYLPYEFR